MKPSESLEIARLFVEQLHGKTTVENVFSNRKQILKIMIESHLIDPPKARELCDVWACGIFTAHAEGKPVKNFLNLK